MLPWTRLPNCAFQRLVAQAGGHRVSPELMELALTPRPGRYTKAALTLQDAGNVKEGRIVSRKVGENEVGLSVP